MGPKVLLKGGSVLHRSDMGYNNFYYPSDNLANILCDEEVDVLPWFHFDDKTPVKVSVSNVEGVSSECEFIVMWKD